ncbi:MAG: dihydroorotate dehydrogenase electron transfer subunit [Deltaproteobacteria bacterium]|nr:dihydroorotate dehydrogenase electron transfer subunit [Deltaproteobacteria bacterium]
MDDRAWVVQREPLGGEYFRLRLRPARPFAAEPGQFVMVKTADGIDPLLRRPFSIHRMLAGSSGEFEVLFRAVGAGTRLLARTHVGDRLDVLAPLGRGFRLGGARPLLVGGGVGVAPLLFLAEAFLAQEVRPRLLLGGRRDRDILCHDDFGCLAVPCALATEDGSLGEPGLVTRLLERELSAHAEDAAVYACGPTPMLAAVARLCRRRSVPCQVSLEAHMACGVGACLGCVVAGTRTAYLRVCKEGPVLDAEEVLWPEPERTLGA